MKKRKTRKDQGTQSAPRNRRLSIALLVVAVGLGLYGISRLMGPGNPDQSDEPAEVPIVDAADPRVPTKSGKSWQEIDDPTKDGWNTEVFTSKAMKQLKKLGELLTHPDDIDHSVVEKLLAGDFVCGALRPAGVVTVLDDQHLKVDRASAATVDRKFTERPASASDRQFQGADDFVEVLRAAAEPFKKCDGYPV